MRTDPILVNDSREHESSIIEKGPKEEFKEELEEEFKNDGNRHLNPVRHYLNNKEVDNYTKKGCIATYKEKRIKHVRDLEENNVRVDDSVSDRIFAKQLLYKYDVDTGRNIKPYMNDPVNNSEEYQNSIEGSYQSLDIVDGDLAEMQYQAFSEHDREYAKLIKINPNGRKHSIEKSKAQGMQTGGDILAGASMGALSQYNQDYESHKSYIRSVVARSKAGTPKGEASSPLGKAPGSTRSEHKADPTSAKGASSDSQSSNAVVNSFSQQNVKECSEPSDKAPSTKTDKWSPF
jgi:hypothetical protein